MARQWSTDFKESGGHITTDPLQAKLAELANRPFAQYVLDLTFSLEDEVIGQYDLKTGAASPGCRGYKITCPPSGREDMSDEDYPAEQALESGRLKIQEGFLALYEAMGLKATAPEDAWFSAEEDTGVVYLANCKFQFKVETDSALSDTAKNEAAKTAQSSILEAIQHYRDTQKATELPGRK